MNLKNKTALITGGSEGLGLELAKMLLAQGAYVIICGRNKDKLAKAETILNNKNLRSFECDISNPQSVAMMMKNITNLDILINNAGVYIQGALESHSIKDINYMIDINSKGVIFTTKYALPLLKRAKEGLIINISSIRGIEFEANRSVYSSSKSAIWGFTESLKIELSDTNIKVMGLYPARMNTDLHKKSGANLDMSNSMTATQAAEALLFAITRKTPMLIDDLILRNK